MALDKVNYFTIGLVILTLALISGIGFLTLEKVKTEVYSECCKEINGSYLWNKTNDYCLIENNNAVAKLKLEDANCTIQTALNKNSLANTFD